jgi:predicted metalloprotease
MGLRFGVDERDAAREYPRNAGSRKSTPEVRMRWRDLRRSGNVEDRRGRGAGGLAIGGGGLLIVLVLALLFGADPQALLQQLGDTGSVQPTDPVAPPGDDEMAQFVSTVLASTEDVWRAQFETIGRQYQEPRLVLFTDRVQSACGIAGAAMGPFYCPGDAQVYIDLGFYDLLRQRFGAPGDFAQAYVIAHEVGHHVQNLLGTTRQMDALRGRVSQAEMNRLSVRLELQADFFAGVWAHHAERSQRLLEEGDLDEALGAASAIGDDRLQRESQGTIVPDSFTHGTSEQRMRWFRLGFDTGDLARGDTFNAPSL